MKSLEEKIEKEGLVLPGNVLKVDSFLNHQIDPVMTMAMGRELIRLFSGVKIDRVLTVEASGIAIGLAAAYYAGAPLVFAKKKKSVLMTEEAYTADVYSYTKKETNTIAVLKKFLPEGEQVLIVDDFLANGEASLGMAELVRKAGSQVAGIGIAVDKAFQRGHNRLIEAGYRLESLAVIDSLDGGKVHFRRGGKDGEEEAHEV